MLYYSFSISSDEVSISGNESMDSGPLQAAFATMECFPWLPMCFRSRIIVVVPKRLHFCLESSLQSMQMLFIHVSIMSFTAPNFSITHQISKLVTFSLSCFRFVSERF